MGVGQRGRPLSFYWSIEMFKFIERFVTRIVSNAITPDFLVRAVSPDTLVEALNRALRLSDIANRLNADAIAETVASRVSSRDIARWVDYNSIIEALDVSEYDITELAVERLVSETMVYDDDVNREIATQWMRNNTIDRESLAMDILRIACKGL